MKVHEHYAPVAAPEAEQLEAVKIDPATVTPEQYAAALARVVKSVRLRAQRSHPAARPSLPREGAAYDTRPLLDRLADDEE